MAKSKQNKTVKTKAPLVETEAVDAEVLPKESGIENPEPRHGVVMRKEEFRPALANLEMSLRNDILKQKNFDKASAMMTIKIGLGLQFAKGIIKHGDYEAWVEVTFGEVFSKRNAQYATKLARKFLLSEHGATLELPAPQEGGNYLIVANENSDNALFRSVQSFVGDKSLPDLYAEHGIKASKPQTPGGWRPATRLLEAYQLENAHLRNKDFEIWSKDDKDAFKEWQSKQLEMDDSIGESLVAEGAWAGICRCLTKHGLEDKTYAHLTDHKRSEISDLLSMIAKNMKPKKS